MFKTLSLILILLSPLLSAAADGQPARHTFTASGDAFLLDGKPFQIIAGEMHYARIPREYWRQRIRMAKAMGLNTISTYVFWNHHELRPGEFDFTAGNRDLAAFIRIVAEEGMWLVLRPGPYACAEWDFGGYPWWLLKEKDLVVRSNDPRFLSAARRYLKRLGDEVGGLQVTRGGPILLVQVENEYGSYGDDKEFVAATRDAIRDAGFDVPLFSADGIGQVRNACVGGVLPAVNGGYTPDALRDTVRKYNGGHGPYFCPEFYPGWLDHWGEEHAVVPAEKFLATYEALLASGISVSLYMVHGGTNFGFMNGANFGGRYQPQPTSYDYDAPIDEAGRPTPKFFAMRSVIKKYLPAGTLLPDPPPMTEVIEIPPVELGEPAPLFRSLSPGLRSEHLLSMEDIDQGYGYILYRTRIATAGTLMLSGVRDYAVVYLDGSKAATIDRRHTGGKFSLAVERVPCTLDILVENGGRINYDVLVDNRKGLIGSVRLDGTEVTGWEIIGLPFASAPAVTPAPGEGTRTAPFVCRGRFQLTKTGDTFLDLRGWGKGMVWVNNHSLGRYWAIGPQQTLYVPGAWLTRGENEIVVFELEGSSERSIRGLRTAVLDELTVDRLKPPRPQRVAGTMRLTPADRVAGGAFAAGDDPQAVSFPAVDARYVVLRSLSSQAADPFASMAEFDVLDTLGQPLSRDRWTVAYVDGEELDGEDGRAENAIDGEPATIWHSLWWKSKPMHPHVIAFDMNGTSRIGGFRYRPRQGDRPGKIKDFEFYARKEAFVIEKTP